MAARGSWIRMDKSHKPLHYIIRKTIEPLGHPESREELLGFAMIRQPQCPRLSCAHAPLASASVSASARAPCRPDRSCPHAPCRMPLKEPCQPPVQSPRRPSSSLITRHHCASPVFPSRAGDRTSHRPPLLVRRS
jgi:hypothetical protein